MAQNGVLPIVGWSIWEAFQKGLLTFLLAAGSLGVAGITFLAGIPIALYGFYRQIVAFISIIRNFVELVS